MAYPGRDFNIRHPHDSSVQTLRGHYVATTLIRAYWSPLHTTGQHYVYSASADGAIYIYGATLECSLFLKKRARENPLT